MSLGEALLKPTQIYVKPILELKKSVSINAVCHITGGYGIIENLPRVIPNHYSALIEESSGSGHQSLVGYKPQGKFQS